jgi:hypothetical protein
MMGVLLRDEVEEAARHPAAAAAGGAQIASGGIRQTGEGRIGSG